MGLLMDKNNLTNATKELIRELCRLADDGVVMPRDEFHANCEGERFVEFLLLKYGEKVVLDYFKKSSSLRKQETVDCINNAFSRYANAQVMEDFGLENNAIFFAVNIAVEFLSREVLG